MNLVLEEMKNEHLSEDSREQTKINKHTKVKESSQGHIDRGKGSAFSTVPGLLPYIFQAGMAPTEVWRIVMIQQWKRSYPGKSNDISSNGKASSLVISTNNWITW